MKRDHRDYLEDILAAIDGSAEFTRDISFEAFTRDRRTVNAVVRSLEVLGEAAGASRTTCAPKCPVSRGNIWLECATSLSTSISAWT